MYSEFNIMSIPDFILLIYIYIITNILHIYLYIYIYIINNIINNICIYVNKIQKLYFKFRAILKW